MQPIDVRPDHLKIVREILVQHVPEAEVWVFGSRAKWLARETSDLDLCIRAEKPLGFSRMGGLRAAFEESNLPYKVDVVDWATTSESFRKVIERDKVVVHTPIEMGDWRETTLGEVCKLQGGSIQTGPFGSQLHASDYTSAGTPVVMPVNLMAGSISEEGIARVSDEETARLARHKLAPGDIVFSRRGDVTRFALVTEREAGWLCGTGCLKVSVGRSTVATPGFIAAVLASPGSKEWLIRHAVGATMPNLNTEILAGIPVTLPPIEEQRAIAETLGTLDDRIDNLRQTNATLEAIAAALFKSRFVDFDGVDDRRRAFTFGEIATLGKGSSNPAAQPETVFQHYSLPAFDAGQMPIAETGAAIKSNKTPVPSGAVLVSKLNPHIPRIWLVGTAGENAVCSTEFLVWTPKPNIGSAFVYCAASSPEFNAAMRQLVTGTSNSHQRVNPDQLANTHAAFASEATIAAFDETTAPLLRRVEHNRQQAATLAALRDTLLPRLISGKLRVGVAARIAEEAA